MIRTLRRKFIAVAMAALLAVLVLLIGSINLLNYHSVIRTSDDTLQLLADNGGAFPRDQRWDREDPEPPFDDDREDKEPPYDDDREDLEPPFDEAERPGMANRPGREAELPFQTRYFSLTYDETGTLQALDLENVAAVTETEAGELGQTALDRGRTRGFLKSYRYVLCSREAGTQIIFLDCQRELDTARSFLLVSLAISGGGLLLVFLLIVLLSGRVVRPISESYEKQKQFITDAGHELKTPLTIISADAEVLEQELPGSEWLQDIRNQTKRLGTLTNDLVYLSRMEEGGSRTRMIDLSLSDLAEEVAKGFQAPALTRDQTLTTRIQPLLTVQGDEGTLRKLISILLDNAVKYTPQGGRIDLSLERAGRNLRLTVANDAETMDKDQLGRLFDRFYRTDASRSSQTGGYGLGLSIAKAVVVAHKGKISAVAPPGKLEIEVLLPEKR